jgi:hypothetical protein
VILVLWVHHVNVNEAGHMDAGVNGHVDVNVNGHASEIAARRVSECASEMDDRGRVLGAFLLKKKNQLRFRVA